jgi:hypothetical protein
VVLVVAVLGAVGAIVTTKLGGSSGVNPEQLPTVTLATPVGPSTGHNKSTLPATNRRASGSNTSASEALACRADYAAFAQAVSAYVILNGKQPASLSDLQSFVKGSSASSYFTITVNPHLAGQLEVATPGHPAQPGSANCAYAP